MAKSRNPDWETVRPHIREGLRKYHSYYHNDCYAQDFPKNCLVPDLVELRGQQNDYSCSLEMAQFGLALQGLDFYGDSEVSQAISLTKNGSD